MALISKPYTFTVGATIVASEHNSNFDVIYSDYNGNITNVNISASATIAYSKLSLVGSITRTDISPSYGLIPSGGIILWSGTIATIPTGWYLCNGSNGTPDLRNLFVVGANADSGGVAKSTITGSALQSGGSTTIDLTQIPAHTHGSVANQSSSVYGVNGGGVSKPDVGTGSTGSSGGGSPYVQPFYALAYIQKS